MPNLSSVRIALNIDILLVCLVLGFSVLVGAYFTQHSVKLEADKQKSVLQTDAYYLGSIHVDLLNMNRLLLEQFSVKEQSDTDIERWLTLRASLNQRLMEVKDRTHNAELIDTLKVTDGLLQEFDSEYLVLSEQRARLGENAKVGLLLELAIAADQLESTLMEMNSTDIQAAVLNMRATEKQLVDAPSAEVLSKIDDEIYGVISLVSNLRRVAPDELSSVMSLIEKYSKKLQQLVKTSEGISSSEKALTLLAERLLIDISMARDRAHEYANSFMSDSVQESVTMRNVFVLFSCLAFASSLFLAIMVRRAVIAPLKKMSEELKVIYKGDTRQRFSETNNNELGKFAQDLNHLVGYQFESFRRSAIDAATQQSETRSLLSSLQSALREKKLSASLPVSSSVIGEVASSLNALNVEVGNAFAQARLSSGQLAVNGNGLQKQVETIGRLGVDEQKQALSLSKALHLSTEAMRELVRRSARIEHSVKDLTAWASDSKSLAASSSSSLLKVQESISEVEARAQSLVQLSQNVQAVEASVSNLSDRTHIVALNSSMCVRDGTADKKILFEDMQNLAKHAEEACSDVSKVFSTVQTDVLDFVKELNRLLENVSSGIESAQQLNVATEKGTEVFLPLLDIASGVAIGSAKQSELMEKLCQRSKVLRKYLEKSRVELQDHKNELRSSVELVEMLDVQLQTFTLSESIDTLNANSFLGSVAQMEVEHIDGADQDDRTETSVKEAKADEEVFA